MYCQNLNFKEDKYRWNRKKLETKIVGIWNEFQMTHTHETISC